MFSSGKSRKLTDSSPVRYMSNTETSLPKGIFNNRGIKFNKKSTNVYFLPPWMQGETEPTYENIRDFLNDEHIRDKKVYRELVRKMKEYLFKLQSEDAINRSTFQKVSRDNEEKKAEIDIKNQEIQRMENNTIQDDIFVTKQDAQIRTLEKYLKE